jgi:ubiquinone/menaquinone biosynthesis C-methylase UbiE
MDGIISIMPDYYLEKRKFEKDTDFEDSLSEIYMRDAQAKKYEEILSHRRDIIEIKTTMRELDVTSSDTVLELGVGTGRTLQYSDQCKLVIGCDFSFESLLELKAKGLKNVIAVQADATRLPFQSERIDKILTVELFHHIPSQGARRQHLSECNRILRSNGELLMSGVYNFTIRERLSDIKMIYTKNDQHGGADGKMGYHTSNTIYYYNFDIRELKAEAELYFHVLGAFGFMVDIGPVGRAMEKVMGAYRADCLWQRTKIGHWFGKNLLIKMRKSLN